MKFVVAIALVCLMSGCTKRASGIGIGVGAGIIIAGAVVFSISSKGDSAPTGGEGAGILMVLGGTGTIGIAVVSLLVQAVVGALPDSAPAKPATSVGRQCVPVTPNSSTWTCGEGFRCTEDFTDCEPANELPALRQR